MAEKKVETVTLIAPNGQTVSVAEYKKAERIAAGYRLPEKRTATKSSANK
ncbi:hypothetical protein NIIDNTM18_42230 [Mycolicibacterium litorale]|uniref:Uncharacterized protein n=1 Tax=Mycolicibacterium litorale TaxID=758802 RepID=A0A6S6P8U9_9MYCO|nr:hypothetical protein [Mycolicibacterium litorale]BCI54945.1 hypothetical protein NIIDNTM18_42230 [Mycolicibacterium litorale]